MHAQADPSLHWMAVDANAIKYLFFYTGSKFFPLKVTLFLTVSNMGEATTELLELSRFEKNSSKTFQSMSSHLLLRPQFLGVFYYYFRFTGAPTL